MARSHAPTRRPLTPLPPRLLTGYRSGAAGRILRALVTPVLAEFAVMKPAQQMRVVIQPVGGTQHLVKVMAVIKQTTDMNGTRTSPDDTSCRTAASRSCSYCRRVRMNGVCGTGRRHGEPCHVACDRGLPGQVLMTT